MTIPTEKDSSLQTRMDKYTMRFASRQEDFDALDFQTKVSPKYRRAQIRYLGGGGTGMHDDPNIIPAEHFTLSTMLLPAGCEGPLHKHHDVEEVFFVMKGQVTIIWEEDGLEVERTLGERDMIFTPAGVYRGLRNDSDEDCLMLVMLGAGRPQLPTYPPGSEMEKARKAARGV
ncbi:MAG TPA: cupin domain-containing protein [Chloroflexia bacterium]|nr:cupin domain-containing protein [Chloroflexia bacterium]